MGLRRDTSNRQNIYASGSGRTDGPCTRMPLQDCGGQGMRGPSRTWASCTRAQLPPHRHRKRWGRDQDGLGTGRLRCYRKCKSPLPCRPNSASGHRCRQSRSTSPATTPSALDGGVGRSVGEAVRRLSCRGRSVAASGLQVEREGAFFSQCITLMQPQLHR